MSVTAVRSAELEDASDIAGIYNHYIANTVVTFEEDQVSAAEMAARIGETQASKLPYLVAEQSGQILGYAYASQWKGRCAYRYTVETTIYLGPSEIGNGLGTLLYRALFQQLAALNYHMAIGGISLPNEASIALHEKFGMQKVAHFSEVGFKFDRWVDVGYWQGRVLANEEPD